MSTAQGHDGVSTDFGKVLSLIGVNQTAFPGNITDQSIEQNNQYLVKCCLQKASGLRSSPDYSEAL